MIAQAMPIAAVPVPTSEAKTLSIVTANSPTLTNPDMILPDKDDESGRSTPTGYEAVSPPSPSAIRPPETRLESNQSTPYHEPPAANTSPPLEQPYRHGGPLSDITERTEETTPISDRRAPRYSTLASSPTVQRPTLEALERRRRSSNASSSTASADSGIGQWLRTDDAEKRHGGSDVGTDFEIGSQKTSEAGETSRRNSMGSNEDEDDEFSSAALTKRAELILANAKKRLTNMETHLSKARNSLLISPQLSPTSSQAGSLYRSTSVGGERGFDLRSRKPRTLVLASKHNGPGHIRIASENAINPSDAKSIYQQPRSASAMEAGYGNSIDSLLYDHSPEGRGTVNKGQSPASASSRTFNTPLRALKEDEVEDVNDTPTSSLGSVRPHGLGITSPRPHDPYDFRQSPSDTVNGVTRSNSQVSTHEIRSQMNSLRNRISTLQTRTQEDKMKRKSLNSLRSSSPFTVAEQWYTGAPEYQGSSPFNTSAGMGWSPINEQPDESAETGEWRAREASPRVADNATPERDVQTAFALRDGSPRHTVGADHQGAKPQSVADSTSEEPDCSSEDSVDATDEEQVYLNEVLEESLHDEEESFEPPEDTGPEPERHEDRADAFDYQNFYLHSALGNYTQSNVRKGRHVSHNSISSTGSVETTRAIPQSPQSDYGDEPDTPRGTTNDGLLRPPMPSHSRNNSVDSISTVASFATATEGNGIEDGEGDEDDDEDVPKSLLNSWGGNRPMPGAIDVSPTKPVAQPYRSKASFSYVAPSAPRNRSSSTPAHSTLHASTSAPIPTSRFSNGALPTPPITSPRESQSQQQPLTYSGVLSSLRAVDSPDPSLLMPLGEGDADLAEGLLKSLKSVCAKMAEEGRRDSRYENRHWRRRLDAARRVLDGALEVDGL